jgi:acyl-coenzyme A thioesterase PaaI-like protein
LREQYERQLLLMLGARSRFTAQGRLVAGHAVASLLNSAPGWMAHPALDEQERDELLGNLISGAIERCLTPRLN